MFDRFRVHVRTLLKRKKEVSEHGTSKAEATPDLTSDRETAAPVRTDKPSLQALISKEEELAPVLQAKMKAALANNDWDLAERYRSELQTRTECIDALKQTLAAAHETEGALEAALRAHDGLLKANTKHRLEQNKKRDVK